MDSEDITQHSKVLSVSNTGIKLQVLEGQRNFRRWKRDFQAIAQAKGLWGYFTGELEVVEFPEWDTFLDFGLDNQGKEFKKSDSADADPDADADADVDADPAADADKSAKTTTKDRRKSRKTLGPEEIMQMGERKITGRNGMDFGAALAYYKFSLDLYERFEKKKSEAMALITIWVHETIRGKLQEYDYPHLALRYLEKAYKISDVRAHELAMNQFEDIHLSKYKNIQTYLNEIELARLDIKDAGGHVDDVMVCSKIIRGLTPAYNAFVDQYHFLRDLDKGEFGLEMLKTRLLTFESDLRQRTGTKVMFTRGNNKRFDDRKCSTCGKKGHTDERCWVTHPELKKSPEEFEAWKKARFQNDKKNSSDEKPAMRKFAAVARVDQQKLRFNIKD